jgi:cobalt/nickel transport system permease protein
MRPRGTAVAAPFVIHGTRAISRTIKEHPEAKRCCSVPRAPSPSSSPRSSCPSVTGSSSHPTGTGLGAVIFRPPVMAALGTIVLLFQALLLAHGGLTTLGANVFSMAVVGPWVGYAAFRLLGRAPFSVRIFAAMALANLATYVMTATQLALAFPGQNGFVGAWSAFLGIFAITQVPLAVIEGLVGVLIFKALRSWAAQSSPLSGCSRAAEDHAGTKVEEAIHA